MSAALSRFEKAMKLLKLSFILLLNNLQAGDCSAFKWSFRLWFEFSKEHREELEVNPMFSRKVEKCFKWKSKKQSSGVAVGQISLGCCVKGKRNPNNKSLFIGYTSVLIICLLCRDNYWSMGLNYSNCVHYKHNVSCLTVFRVTNCHDTGLD